METDHCDLDSNSTALVHSHRGEFVRLLTELAKQDGGSPGEPCNASSIVERAWWIMAEADRYEEELWGRLGLCENDDPEDAE